MNRLVKIIRDDDGEKIDEPKWHLVQEEGGGDRTVCSGEVFGEGESNVLYEERYSETGGITCKKCLRIVDWFQNISL